MRDNQGFEIIWYVLVVSYSTYYLGFGLKRLRKTRKTLEMSEESQNSYHSSPNIILYQIIPYLAVPEMMSREM